MSLSLELEEIFEASLLNVEKKTINFGVAVSGGSDSVALLMLLLPWSLKNNKKLFVVTVDHGLRRAAIDEASYVKKLCLKNSVKHEILKINKAVKGNVQAWARENRYKLISKWAKKNRIQSVFLGHTLNDQAETVLLRLGRGSGVDGLAGMRSESIRENLLWLRPLLNIDRFILRDFLKSKNVTFIDDPSNEDTKFNRVKVRKLLSKSNDFGLDSIRLNETASRMSQARDVLNKVAFEFAKKNIFVSQIGTLVIDLPTFEDELPETKFRILLYSIKWISGNIYGARAKAIEYALQESINGKARTIGGCVIFRIEDKLHIWREYNAVKNLTQVNGIWDGRWSVPKAIETRACGMDGLKNIENWKAIDLPKKALVSMPTIWKNGKVIDYIFSEDKRSSIKLITPRKDFYTGILSY